MRPRSFRARTWKVRARHERDQATLTGVSQAVPRFPVNSDRASSLEGSENWMRPAGRRGPRAPSGVVGSMMSTPSRWSISCWITRFEASTSPRELSLRREPLHGHFGARSTGARPPWPRRGRSSRPRWPAPPTGAGWPRGGSGATTGSSSAAWHTSATRRTMPIRGAARRPTPCASCMSRKSGARRARRAARRTPPPPSCAGHAGQRRATGAPAARQLDAEPRARRRV